MAPPPIIDFIRYVWTEPDFNTAQVAQKRNGAGAESYVTPYKIFPWNIADAKTTGIGTAINFSLGVTDQQSYVRLFKPDGLDWTLIPKDIGSFSKVRELFAALLKYNTDHKTDIFPPELYDLSRSDHQPPGGLAAEKLLFDYWGNSDWRYCCSQLNAAGGTFSWSSQLDLPTSVAATTGTFKVTWVLSKAIATGSRAVAPKGSGSGSATVVAPKRVDNATYKKALDDYIAKVKGRISFQRCDIKIASVGFDSKFDATYWEIVDDPRWNKKLRLKGDEAHTALQAIYDSPEKWSFDCSQFTQVAQMYARMKTMGGTAYDKTVGKLEIREHEAPGTGRGDVYSLEMNVGNKSQVYTGKLTSPGGDSFTVEEVLAGAPIGSMVTWTKPNERKPPPDDSDEAAGPYLQENALKIGDDQYYSHGFDHNPYTRATFEAEYKQVHTPGDVFVQAVEYVTYPDPP